MWRGTADMDALFASWALRVCLTPQRNPLTHVYITFGDGSHGHEQRLCRPNLKRRLTISDWEVPMSWLCVQICVPTVHTHTHTHAHSMSSAASSDCSNGVTESSASLLCIKVFFLFICCHRSLRSQWSCIARCTLHSAQPRSPLVPYPFVHHPYRVCHAKIILSDGILSRKISHDEWYYWLHWFQTMLCHWYNDCIL